MYMRVVRGETKGHHSALQQPAGGSLSPLRDQDLEGAAIISNSNVVASRRKQPNRVLLLFVSDDLT